MSEEPNQAQVELAETQAKLAAAAEIGRHLLEQNEQLQMQIALMQQQNAANEARLHEFEAKAEETTTIRVENDRLRSGLAMMEGHLQEASRLNARLQEEVKEKENTIQQLNKTTTIALDVENTPQYKELQARMDEFSVFLGNAKTAIENLSAANARLTEEKESAETEKKALQSQVTELEAEVQKTNELRDSVRFLKQKNEELQNRPKENVVFGPNHPLSQLDGPIRAVFEDQAAEDAAGLLKRATSIFSELDQAFANVKNPGVGLLGQTMLDLIRAASNPGRKAPGAAGGGQQQGMHGNEATALMVVSMLALQKLRESTTQIRKKNDEYNELSEDFQQTKATLQREQQAKPKMQQQISSLATENEEMKLKIARLEKDLEGREPADDSAARAEIKTLEEECDRLRLQLIDTGNKNLRQITECNEEILKLRKKAQQLEHQLLRTEMMLAEKNAFLAEQQALIDQFNFFN